MKKIRDDEERTTRQQLANPHGAESLENRRAKSGAVDLRGNRRVEPLGKGYGRIKPIDPSKRLP